VHGTIGFRLEWRPLAALAQIAGEWRALAARALVPNVFYEPTFALAAAPVFGRDTGVSINSTGLPKASPSVCITARSADGLRAVFSHASAG